MQKHVSITLAERDLKAGKNITPVAEHFLKHHNGRYMDLQVFGLEKISLTIRGGDLTAALLHKESQWIYTLNSLDPTGLNEELLYTGFLDD